jgi:UDP-glucose 4-epimerase
MKIFITGGTGFIGKQVVKELANGKNSLLLLTRRPSSSFVLPPKTGILQGDLSQISSLKNALVKFSPDVALHMAWEGLPRYDEETSKRNLNYGLALVKLLAETRCKSLIVTGSCWEYGFPSDKVSEDDGYKPHNAFTAAKNALREQGEQIAREHGMRFTWLRLFFVYGPEQRETSLIPFLIGSLRKGEQPAVKTPRNKNDFIYVEDAARAIAMVAGNPPRDGIFNIGSGFSTSVQEVLENISRRFNFNLKYDTLSKTSQSEITDFWADISKIKKTYGWKPQISIGEGIERTIKYTTEESGK